MQSRTLFSHNVKKNLQIVLDLMELKNKYYIYCKLNINLVLPFTNSILVIIFLKSSLFFRLKLQPLIFVSIVFYVIGTHGHSIVCIISDHVRLVHSLTLSHNTHFFSLALILNTFTWNTTKSIIFL